MKIIKNEKLINRNAKIGQWTSLAGVIVLGAGMFITWKYPQQFNYALVSLLAGFILTQISIYLGSRFGRSPRPDEKLDAALKGLPGDFTIYHFTTPVPHLLVGPAGTWVLLPYHQSGKVMYRNNRWKMAGGGFVQGYMRIFGQENLGRPEAEAESQIKSLEKELSKRTESEEMPETQAILVFTNDAVELEAEGAPTPAVKAKQLKDFMRQKAKEQAYTADQLRQINSMLTED